MIEKTGRDLELISNLKIKTQGMTMVVE